MNRFSRKQIVVAAFVLAFTGFAGGGSAQKRSPVAPRGKKVGLRQWLGARVRAKAV